MAWFDRMMPREIVNFSRLSERANLMKAEADLRDALSRDDQEAARRIAAMGPAERDALKRALGVR